MGSLLLLSTLGQLASDNWRLQLPGSRASYLIFCSMQVRLVEQHSDQPRPTGLMARTKALARLSMKVFVEQKIVLPVGIPLDVLVLAIEGTLTAVIAQEETHQAL